MYLVYRPRATRIAGAVASIGGARVKRIPIAIGAQFGRLTVVSKDYSRGSLHWLCRCSCGKMALCVASNLRTGNTRSCGCLKRELQTSHGGADSKLYRVWNCMNQRCFNQKAQKYENWGGRGISVCEEWRTFAPFQEWALSNGYSEGLTLDRKDNDGNYCPDNCRWSTYAEQNRNRRGNRWITFGGKTQVLEDWAKDLDIAACNLINRLNKWPLERALTERPIKRSRTHAN
jgi:hypothetical protein